MISDMRWNIDAESNRDQHCRHRDRVEIDAEPAEETKDTYNRVYIHRFYLQ